jgi:HSP20 family protein
VRKTDEEVRNEHYYRQERCFGSFERSFTLPSDIDPAKISANFKDGILRIEIPKIEVKKPKQIKINVE